MRKNQIKFFESLIISFVWVIFFSAPLLLGQFEDQINWNHVFRTWFDYLPLLLLFIVNRFILLPKLFFRNRRLLYIISTGSLIILVTTISFINERQNRVGLDRNQIEQRLPPNGPANRRPPSPANRGELKRLPPKQDRRRPQPVPPYLSLFFFRY